MSKLIVKHYKAVKPGSAPRTLVSVVVTTSSETLEKIRISRLCFELIDIAAEAAY